MKHLILKSVDYDRREYGTLSEFVEIIISKTGAKLIHAGTPSLAGVEKKIGHGMRLDFLRKYAPKKELQEKGDVLWVPLMAPEDFSLDLYRGWEQSFGVKVLYLFDTLPHQYKLIKKITDSYQFDLLITSFAVAVKPLEALTKRKWLAVPQGVLLERFRPDLSRENEMPHVYAASFGRRLETFHDFMQNWSEKRKLEYRYSTIHKDRSFDDIKKSYREYSEILKNSFLNICWPIEKTNPERAGNLSPITCRWFEAAAAGNTIVGKAPKDETMRDLFGENPVIEVPENPKLWDGFLSDIEKNKKLLREEALKRIESHSHKWSWAARVEEVQHYISKVV